MKNLKIRRNKAADGWRGVLGHTHVSLDYEAVCVTLGPTTMVNRRVNQALVDPNCLRSLTKPFFPFRDLLLPEGLGSHSLPASRLSLVDRCQSLLYSGRYFTKKNLKIIKSN